MRLGAHLSYGFQEGLTVHWHCVVRIRLDVVDDQLFLLVSALFKHLNLLFLLRLSQSIEVDALVFSESEEGSLVSLLLGVVKVLVMSLFKNLVPVRLVVLKQLLAEPKLARFLLIENLLDLRLIHEDVSEVKILSRGYHI